MKTKSFFYLSAIFCAFMFTSCEEESAESCDKFDVEGINCPVSIDAAATLCLDGVTNAYYTYGGEKFECEDPDGADCDAAITAISVKLIEAGCSTKKSATLDLAMIKHAEKAANLLEEVRSKSLCN